MFLSCELLGKMRGPPSQLQRVCVGPSTTSQRPGRVNISWDPLPCHLQNGADVRDYIMQYIDMTTGVATNISNSDRRLHCRQEHDGPYLCLANASLFTSGVAYSFQVAPQSIRGIGPFSDPVTTVYGFQGTFQLLIDCD